MAKQFPEITDTFQAFIKAQKIFFVATATAEGRVNLSPKVMDSLRVLDRNRVVWLNVTGSGNESAAHVQVNPRMTLMFCAFEGAPMILRLYGTAQVIHKTDPAWAELFPLFKPLPGARQIFDVAVELVQSSCGMAVPFFDYAGEREQLSDWAAKKGPAELEAYWQEKNQFSLDGQPTHILEKNVQTT
jgi:hypothetical protein